MEGNATANGHAGEALALEERVISSTPRPSAEVQPIGGTPNFAITHGATAIQASHPRPQRDSTTLLAVLTQAALTPTRTSSGRANSGRFIATVYSITTMELIIRRNKKNVVGDENQWTFGQIVALLVTAGSFTKMFRFILTYLTLGGGRVSAFNHPFCCSIHESLILMLGCPRNFSRLFCLSIAAVRRGIDRVLRHLRLQLRNSTVPMARGLTIGDRNASEFEVILIHYLHGV